MFIRRCSRVLSCCDASDPTDDGSVAAVMPLPLWPPLLLPLPLPAPLPLWESFLGVTEAWAKKGISLVPPLLQNKTRSNSPPSVASAASSSATPELGGTAIRRPRTLISSALG